jgi:hypothetical protein
MGISEDAGWSFDEVYKLLSNIVFVYRRVDVILISLWALYDRWVWLVVLVSSCLPPISTQVILYSHLCPDKKWSTMLWRASCSIQPCQTSMHFASTTLLLQRVTKSVYYQAFLVVSIWIIHRDTSPRSLNQSSISALKGEVIYSLASLSLPFELKFLEQCIFSRRTSCHSSSITLLASPYLHNTVDFSSQSKRKVDVTRVIRAIV